MTFFAAGFVAWLAIALQIAPGPAITPGSGSAIDDHRPSAKDAIAAEPGPSQDVRSPAEIEASKLGPPVRTKTLRITPDGKPK